jgi:hypothetical protein
VNIRLHIDELVLHGFTPGDRYRIAEAVQGELSRMFLERGVPSALANGGNVGRVNAGSFSAGVAAKPETTGGQIAEAVYGGLDTWASE